MRKKKESTAEKRDRLRDDCNKALQCLYLAVPEDIARDVNIKVKSYIDFLCDSGMKLAAGLTILEAKTGKPEKCSHKFVDSNRCLKCGWSPDD